MPIRLGKRLGFESCALVDRIGAEQPVEIARAYALDSRPDRAEGIANTALRVLGEQKAEDAARGIFQSGFDGMEAEKPDRTVFIGMTVASAGAFGFGTLRGFWPLRGKPAEALLVAPRLIETGFLQGLASKTRGFAALGEIWSFAASAAAQGHCRFSD